MAFSKIIQIMGVACILLTAHSTPSMAKPVHCKITEAPVINIRPQTKEIEYDLTKTSAQLSQIKNNTISPYGLNTDQTTGGLRHDQPTMTTEVKYNFTHNLVTQTICLSYHTINVDILLQPKIYIAKEFNRGRCAREVKEHEKKHVTVDRQVINKYTKLMGYAIQKAVNQAGVIGPFPIARRDEMEKMMGSTIKSAVNSIRLSMANEMNQRQQEVDSLKEYERVSKYCKSAAKKVFNARRRK